MNERDAAMVVVKLEEFIRDIILEMASRDVDEVIRLNKTRDELVYTMSQYIAPKDEIQEL